MNIDQIRNATEEQLRTRLAELRGTKRTTIINRDPDEVQAEKFDAMASAYGEQDIESMLNMQSKAQQYRDKKDATANKKIEIENAIKNLNEISAVWREDPDNKLKQDQVRDAWNRASTLGAKVQNPIDDYLREQYNASQMGLAEKKFASEEERRKIQDQQWEANYKLQAQNIANDNQLAWANYALAQKKAEQEKGTGTDAEKKSAGFSARMKNAIAIMNETLPQLGKMELTLIMAGSPVNSSDGQRYKSALEDYVRAQLRQESGATIGDGEMKGGFSQYGVSPLDSKELIADKMKRLEVGYNAMLSNAGVNAKRVEDISGGKKPDDASPSPVVPPAKGKLTRG